MQKRYWAVSAALPWGYQALWLWPWHARPRWRWRRSSRNPLPGNRLPQQRRLLPKKRKLLRKKGCHRQMKLLPAMLLQPRRSPRAWRRQPPGRRQRLPRQRPPHLWHRRMRLHLCRQSRQANLPRMERLRQQALQTERRQPHRLQQMPARQRLPMRPHRTQSRFSA